MYYPARIKQLINSPSPQMDNVRELAYYYRELFETLSQQTVRQIKTDTKVDGWMVGYALHLIRKIAQAPSLPFAEKDMDNTYMSLTACLDNYKLTEQQVNDLFTPSTVDFRFLVVKQIMRELGEQAHARGCGIQASLLADNNLQIQMIFTQKIWKNSK